MSKNLKSALIVGAAFLAIFIFIFSKHDKFKDTRGRETFFEQDVNQYYSYLPAYFIHDDLDFNFENNYWLIDAGEGRKVPKVTMGMAIMYSPWFLIADNIAKGSPEYTRDGYSKPYVEWVRYGVLFYFFLGLFFLALTLLKFYKAHIVAITITVLFLGSNLVYYTLGQGEYPHVFLFSLFSIIIYLTVKWHEKEKWHHVLLIGLIAGLCALIRPTAIFILMVPLFYNIKKVSDIREKLIFLRGNIWKILVAGILFFLPLIPQLLFWKEHTGNYLFFSYGSDERFFFGQPHIFEFLAGYRKGWLIYTPLMALAITGIFFLRDKAKNFKLGVPVILVVTVYIFSSWWAWWYGGSFGMRAMVQYYAVMAIPLAAIINWAFNKWFSAIPLVCLMVFFVSLNLVQTMQYKNSMIHWDSMTKEAYWYVIEHPKFETEEHWNTFESLLHNPDYEAAKRGEDS